MRKKPLSRSKYEIPVIAVLVVFIGSFAGDYFKSHGWAWWSVGFMTALVTG